MSLSHHPSIVKNGLVLNYDAANKKSYSGDGTSWLDLKTRTSATMTNITPVANNGGAFSYNGTSSNTINSSIITGVSEFTVIVWFNCDSITNYRNILDFNYTFYTAGNAGPRLEVGAGGSLAWVFSGNTTSDAVYTLGSVLANGLQANTWYCCAITRSSTPTINTYLNGVYRQSSISQGGSNASAFVGTFNKITTGVGYQNTANRYYSGYIANVLAYNRQLTANEILQNYNATKSRFGY